MFGVFTLAIKFDCFFSGIFSKFSLICDFNFWQLAFKPCAPQNTACAPEIVSVISFQEEKHEWKRRLSLRFRAKDLFLVFTPEFVNKSEIRTIWFRRTPQARLVPRKKVNGQVKDLYFCLHFRRWGWNLSVPPQTFFLLPQSRYSSAKLEYVYTVY